MRSWLALLVVAAACGSPTLPSGIRVTTTVSAGEIKAGERVAVTVVAHNVSDKTRQIFVGCPPPFVVMRQDGVVVGPAEQFCTAIARPPTDLAPGDSLTFVSQWTGDARSGQVQMQPNLVSPGTYLVRGEVGVVGDGLVVSEPVEIRVVP